MIWAQSFNPLTAYVAIAFTALAIGVIAGYAGWVLYCLMVNAQRARPVSRQPSTAAIPMQRRGVALAAIPRALALTSLWGPGAAHTLTGTEPKP
jgi:hypothetical protein